jgi:hypothetical protein
MILAKIKRYGENASKQVQEYESENRILHKDGKYLWHLTKSCGFKR